MIQQGRPFSSESKFVSINRGLERRSANQIAFAKSCLLVGRYLEEWLDGYWSTVNVSVVILFPEVNGGIIETR